MTPNVATFWLRFKAPGVWRTALLAIGLLCAASNRPVRAAEDTPQSLVAHGAYQQAIALAEQRLARSPNQADLLAALLQAMVETGDYQKAAERGDEFLKRKADAAVAVLTAEACMETGEYSRAEATLGRYPTAQALWMRGTLAKRKGDRASARALFSEAAALLGRATSGSAGPSAMELAAIADSMAELAQYKEANQVYQSAGKLFPEDAALKARWAALFLAKHNPGEAEGLFREALKINPKSPAALLGMATLAAGGWDNKATELAGKALDVNPNLADARLLLVRLYLEQESYAAAEKEFESIDRLNPRLLDSWTLHAVAEYMQGHGEAVEKQWIPKILAENPSYGEVFAALGDFAVIRRQYQQAVDYYRRALEKDPDLDDARSSLGINVFRLGEEDEARQILEEAYRRDPYNIWTVNSLRLMDSLQGYDTFETERFRVRLNKKESALLWPYIKEVLEQSYASLTARYGYSPPTKVLLEVFPDHEDFAVRTLGIPGLGALGASFGPVVAMDSPSARPVGEFHWGSTLWHEFAHVITLGMTSNRVPRWFTEGLSVYEESHAHPGWGDPMQLELVQALQKYGLVPIAKLDGVFVRPQYPTQVVFAYFQAGMICDFIADNYGFPKIVEMLKAYAAGNNDAGAIHDVLGLSLAEFDKAFAQYARVKTYGFGEAVHFDRVHVGGLELPLGQQREKEQQEEHSAPAPGQDARISADHSHDFIALLRDAAELRKQSQLAQAIAAAEAAKKLFPLYIEEGNPYELLAGIYEEQGQTEKAIEELAAWKIQKGRDPKLFKKLADLQVQSGRPKDAIATLTDALQVSMFDPELHDRLAALGMEQGDAKLAVREYRAVVALDPPDKAAAHYRLATAYWKQADKPNARREILQSLEIAPGYRPAQQLLLEMNK